MLTNKKNETLKPNEYGCLVSKKDNKDTGKS